MQREFDYSAGDTALLWFAPDAMNVGDDNHHNYREEVDALLIRSAQNRRKLTRIAEELNQFWQRARRRAPKKRR